MIAPRNTVRKKRGRMYFPGKGMTLEFHVLRYKQSVILGLSKISSVAFLVSKFQREVRK